MKYRIYPSKDVVKSIFMAKQEEAIRASSDAAGAIYDPYMANRVAMAKADVEHYGQILLLLGSHLPNEVAVEFEED